MPVKNEHDPADLLTEVVDILKDADRIVGDTVGDLERAGKRLVGKRLDQAIRILDDLKAAFLAARQAGLGQAQDGESSPAANLRPKPVAPVDGPTLSEGLIAGLLVALYEGDYEVVEQKDFVDHETNSTGKEIAVQLRGTDDNPLPHTFLIMRSIGGKAGAKQGKILVL